MSTAIELVKVPCGKGVFHGFTGLSSSRCRSNKKKQPPLTAAERAAFALQMKVNAADAADAELGRIEVKQAVNLLLKEAMLSERQERVVRLRFFHDVELAVIARQFDVTIERIRQLEVKGLKKLRRAALILVRRGAI